MSHSVALLVHSSNSSFLATLQYGNKRKFNKRGGTIKKALVGKDLWYSSFLSKRKWYNEGWVVHQTDPRRFGSLPDPRRFSSLKIASCAFWSYRKRGHAFEVRRYMLNISFVSIFLQIKKNLLNSSFPIILYKFCKISLTLNNNGMCQMFETS